MTDARGADPTSTSPTRSTPHVPTTVTSRELMGNARELIILHSSEQYRLRITSNGKLILTK